jgi:hypothetical protein
MAPPGSYRVVPARGIRQSEVETGKAGVILVGNWNKNQLVPVGKKMRCRLGKQPGTGTRSHPWRNRWPDRLHHRRGRNNPGHPVARQFFPVHGKNGLWPTCARVYGQHLAYWFACHPPSHTDLARQKPWSAPARAAATTWRSSDFVSPGYSANRRSSFAYTLSTNSRWIS